MRMSLPQEGTHSSRGLTYSGAVVRRFVGKVLPLPPPKKKTWVPRRHCLLNSTVILRSRACTFTVGWSHVIYKTASKLLKRLSKFQKASKSSKEIHEIHEIQISQIHENSYCNKYG